MYQRSLAIIFAAIKFKFQKKNHERKKCYLHIILLVRISLWPSSLILSPLHETSEIVYTAA